VIRKKLKIKAMINKLLHTWFAKNVSFETIIFNYQSNQNKFIFFFLAVLFSSTIATFAQSGDTNGPVILCESDVRVYADAAAECAAAVIMTPPTATSNCSTNANTVSGNGTVEQPFTNLVSARSVRNGTYFFDVYGTEFSSIVEDGWILIASQSSAQKSGGKLTETATMTLQSTAILAPSVFADTSISSIRINATGKSTEGAAALLDVTTSSPEVLANLKANRTLTAGVMGGENEWAGLDEKRLEGTCTSVVSTLAKGIFHACGNHSGLHWLPSHNFYEIDHKNGKNNLNLWVKADISIVNDYNGTSDASGAYPVGTTKVIWTAIDGCGNTSTCEQMVTVEDNVAPTITLIGGAAINHDVSTPYNDLGITSKDNCAVTVLTTGTVDVNTLGNYTLIYTATDASENRTTATRTVNVRDATQKIVCTPDVRVYADSDACVADIIITSPTVTDTCCSNEVSGNGTVEHPFTSLGSSSSVRNGTYFFDINGTEFSSIIEDGWILIASQSSAQKSGGQLTETATMTLQSTSILAPSVFADTSILSIRINATGSSTEGVAALLDVTTSSPEVLANLRANRTLTAGVMGGENEWAGLDEKRLNGPCTSLVSTLAKGIFHACGNHSGLHWLPSHNFYEIDHKNGKNNLNLWIKADMATSNSSIDLLNDFNGTSDASGAYPVGTTKVIWTATDAAGNTATCEQMVTVHQDMGALESFVIFSSEGAIGNTGVSTVTGDIGTYVGAITGFDSKRNGSSENANAKTIQAKKEVLNLYIRLSYAPVTTATHAPVFGNGETLSAGVYSIAAAGSLVGDLTLDGKNDPNSLFIFKYNGAFSVAAASKIILTNGQKAANIFWIAEGAISIGEASTIKGNLLAHTGAVSLGAKCDLEGRMFSTTGAVTLDSGNAYLPSGPSIIPSIPVTNSLGGDALLGSVAKFAIFTGIGAVSNTGASGIIGDVGSNDGAVTGFESSETTLIDNIYMANEFTAQAKIDLEQAYEKLSNMQGSALAPALSGMTLVPGVYAVPEAGTLTGTITLDGQGDSNAEFVIKFGGAFSTEAQSRVNLINGARFSNVYWVAEGGISMGASSFMKGTLIAHNAAVSMGARGNLEGRMLSNNGAIGFDTAVAYVGCLKCADNAAVTNEKKSTTKSAIGKIADAPNVLESSELMAYPNPFATSTTARFALPYDAANTTLTLYDLKGATIQVLYSKKTKANQQYEVQLTNQNLSKGIYLLKLVTSREDKNFKLIVK
jgi:hypothetical protein